MALEVLLVLSLFFHFCRNAGCIRVCSGYLIPCQGRQIKVDMIVEVLLTGSIPQSIASTNLGAIIVGERTVIGVFRNVVWRSGARIQSAQRGLAMALELRTFAAVRHTIRRFGNILVEYISEDIRRECISADIPVHPKPLVELPTLLVG